MLDFLLENSRAQEMESRASVDYTMQMGYSSGVRLRCIVFPGISQETISAYSGQISHR